MLICYLRHWGKACSHRCSYAHIRSIVALACSPLQNYNKLRHNKKKRAKKQTKKHDFWRYNKTILDRGTSKPFCVPLIRKCQALLPLFKWWFVITVNTRDDVSWRQCDGEEKGKLPTVKGFLSGLKSRSPARLYSLRSPRAVVYCCVLTLPLQWGYRCSSERSTLRTLPVFRWDPIAPSCQICQ